MLGSSGIDTVELVGQEIKHVLVSQAGVAVSTRYMTGAIADGQLAEVDLESGLSHSDDDGAGCRGTRV